MATLDEKGLEHFWGGLKNKLASKPVLLWSGAWGAAGASALTVPNFSNYTKWIFVMLGEHIEVEPLSGATIYLNAIVTASDRIQIRGRSVGVAGNTLSVNNTHLMIITTSAAVSYASNTNNDITEIYGVIK